MKYHSCTFKRKTLMFLCTVGVSLVVPYTMMTSRIVQTRSLSLARNDLGYKVAEQYYFPDTCQLFHPGRISALDEIAEMLIHHYGTLGTKVGPLPQSLDDELIACFQEMASNGTWTSNRLHTSNTELSDKGKILILASLHTGSTLTGGLFGAHPNVLYLYEPLHLVSLHNPWWYERKDQHLMAHYLKMLYGCQFLQFVEMAQWKDNVTEKIWRWWLKRTFKGIKLDDDVSNYNHTLYLERLCRPPNMTIAIKTIRVESISAVLPLILEGTKVIYLVRDPRGIAYSSFKTRSTTHPIMYRYIGRQCQKYHRNIEFLANVSRITALRSLFEKGLCIFRYEDLFFTSLDYVTSLFQFATLRVHASVYAALRKNLGIPGVMNISEIITAERLQKSRERALAWRRFYNSKTIALLENKCEFAHEALGYLKYTNESEMWLKDMHVPFAL